MKIERYCLALALLLLNSTYALSDTLLWTTGASNAVFQDGCGCFGRPTPSSYAYISGHLDSSSPQRWAAVPFRLDALSRITQIDAYYYDPTSFVKDVEYIIWNRSGLAAPTTLAASGSLGPYIAQADDLHQHEVDLSLVQGDYYLTIYGAGTPGSNAYLAWLTGGEKQDPSLEQNFLWRSAKFPSPGFEHYTYTGSTNLLADPKDVYNLAFAIYGEAVPEPSGLVLITFGMVCLGCRWRRRSTRFILTTSGLGFDRA